MGDSIFENFLFELGLIITLATILGLIARMLKQPPILAYIITGVLIGPTIFNFVTSLSNIYIFSQLGIAFLLFLVGLSMNPRILREIGKVACITGIGQIIFTFGIGFLLCLWFGFGPIPAFYISLALTFSSTIIIVKLLSDKNDLDTLYGKISIGFLLVQDFVVIIALALLSGIVSLLSVELLFFSTLAKLGLLLAITFIFAKWLAKPLFEFFARTGELLFLLGISWCFILAMISAWLGFSIEIGAFLAGISLAALPYRYELTGRIRPLRDFFLVLFFVVLGIQMAPSLLSPAYLIPVAVFTCFVLIGNPLIVMILIGLLGFRKRTGFLAGLTVAQISEFSLILALLGLRLGHLTQGVVAMITLVGLLTIAISSYMILHGDKLYNIFSHYLGIFERKRLKERLIRIKKSQYDTVLLGYHRIGWTILKGLPSIDKVLIVDFNPSIIKKLIKKQHNCMYGDVADLETLNQIQALKPKLVISTIPSFEDNLVIINRFKKAQQPNRIIVFVTANEVQDALELYRAGADYVIFPYFLGGQKVADTLKIGKVDLNRLRTRHMRTLEQFAAVDMKI